MPNNGNFSFAAFFARLTRNVFIGLVAGLLIGLLLVLLDVVENPFWSGAVGIGAAVVLTLLVSARELN